MSEVYDVLVMGATGHKHQRCAEMEGQGRFSLPGVDRKTERALWQLALILSEIATARRAPPPQEGSMSDASEPAGLVESNFES